MATDPRRQGNVRAPRAILATLIAGSLLTGCASTGAIQGRVRLPRDPKSTGAAKRSTPAKSAARSLTTEAVILAWRESDTRPDPASERERVRVVQSGGRFIPRLVVVPPGATIEFENKDRVYHNVFSVSPIARFDLGNYAPGQVRHAPFARAGVAHVFCELHPNEVVYVVVSPDRWQTQPTANGSFTFPKVPRGTYLVRAFHPALGDVTKRVKVEAKKTALISFGS